uniref:Uncharacterized protein n=1 Tax=Anguilla anguilla TaxID=7936 RepID=A0A0E9TLR4_ANGAN
MLRDQKHSLHVAASYERSALAGKA